jgi:hypothetical protein
MCFVVVTLSLLVATVVCQNASLKCDAFERPRGSCVGDALKNATDCCQAKCGPSHSVGLKVGSVDQDCSCGCILPGTCQSQSSCEKLPCALPVLLAGFCCPVCLGGDRNKECSPVPLVCDGTTLNELVPCCIARCGPGNSEIAREGQNCRCRCNDDPPETNMTSTSSASRTTAGSSSTKTEIALDLFGAVVAVAVAVLFVFGQV